MADVDLITMLAPVAQSSNTKYRLSLETSYGLVIEAGSEAPLVVRLAAPADKSDQKQHQVTADEQPTKGYRYYLSPDYQTSFMWYTAGWEGNPADEYNVEEDVLGERYAAAWCAALEAWVKTYTVVFEAQECHLGSKKEPFPDAAERRRWLLDGLLLTLWLGLQHDVDAVSYDAEPESVFIRAGSEDAEPRIVLSRYLEYLNAKGSEGSG